MTRVAEPVPRRIAAVAESAPEAVALVAPGRAALSYGRLARQIEDAIAALGALGVGRDDRVALVAPPAPETAVALIAVTAVAACAPLDPALPAAELDRHLSLLRATAVIVPAGAPSPARSVARSRGLVLIELEPTGPLQAPGPTPAGPPRTPRVPPRPARRGDVAVVLRTSGTTSRPKVVPLTHANISASASNIQAALRLARTDRCLNVMPLFHVHGLMATLASLVAGGSVVIPPAFDVARFFDWMEQCRPTWYTAVPAIHHAVVEQAPHHSAVIARRPLRFIRSSSAALPPRLGAELERIFGSVVVESYGMTEAAHQIASNPLPPGTRKRGSVGVAAGPEVAVMNGAGTLLPPGETGEIVVRGAQVMPGYDDTLAPDPAVFTDGWLKTGDQGRLDADGYLFITGRLKEVINRGGEKISPREIDEALLEHPAVAQAVSFPVAHPTLGEDVAAAVALRAGSPVTEDALRRFAGERLALFKVPGRVVIVDEIPKGATGKVERRALAGTLGMERPEGVGRAAARDGARPATQALVAAVWTEVLGVEPVGVDDNFFALGGDSIRATLVVARLRDALGVEVSLRTFFETPTVAGLAGRIDATRAEAPAAPAPRLTRVRRDGDVPLSSGQARLWFLDQLDPASARYNRVLALRLTGRVDVSALARSLDAIHRRHEALRTVFPSAGGEPRAVILPHARFALPLVDLRALPPGERDARAQRWTAEEARRRFDLTRGPLWRAALLRVNEQEFQLVLTLHHIVFDGWSVGVVNRELAALYRAFTSGRPSPLPEPALQYADYASWQRRWLQGEIVQTQLAYWRSQLAGRLPRLALPTDRPRPAVPGGAGAAHVFVLPAPLTAGLTALGRREGVTLFMTLLAAFAALLHRHSGQDEIVIGSPVAGRTRVELEDLVGFFVNTLVLRADLSGDPTFRDVLARVREVALGAYAHQDLPFEKLVEALEPGRDGARAPLISVMFALQNAPATALSLPGVSVRAVETDGGPAKFDLSLSMTEDEGTLRGVVEYDPELFDATTIARMFGQFRMLLEGVAADPARRVSRLPLVPEAERPRLLAQGTGARADYPREAGVHGLFEAQAARTPDAVAVVAGDDRLTYEALNRRANQLAHRLRRLGVGPGTPVAVGLERSAELVVALLGILKAGGAYLPLEPGHPTERVRFVLEDAGAAVVVTEAGRLDRVAPRSATLLLLDAEREALAHERGDNPATATSAEHLAYVMYTSGSTGRPKGVAVPHRAVVRLLLGQEYVRLDAGETLLQAAPIAFDASTFELWGALLHGARCVLFPAEPPTPQRLGEVIARHGVTTLWLTASLFNSVIEEAPAALAPIRQLLIGGEALSVPHVRRALEALPGTVIVNGYGPTETTTFACCYRVPRPLPSGTASIPIGRPIANTEVYVVDPDLQPVPIGVPGELLIGGDGLARGYLKRPELTAAKFVPHPFGGEPGARLYRTGDLVRYRADGNLEFLGRIDAQVKIRGHRVEPGEIEAVLRGHPAVRQSVVVPADDGAIGKRLVAYVVAAPGRSVTGAELRAFLEPRLPRVMIPSAFVRLEALPLTPNGKVDRRALPAPPPADVAPARTFVAPRTSLEDALARIWAEVLGLARVGVRDDFFELGGHSLLGVRLFARIEEVLGKRLPLATLFAAPTIEQLARGLREDRWVGPLWSSLVAIQPRGSRPPLFCPHPHFGHVLRYYELARALGPEQPVYGLQARGLDGVQEPATRIDAMAAHYVREVRELQPEGPYFLAGYCFGGFVAFEMARQLHAEGQRVGLLALLDSPYPRRPTRLGRLRLIAACEVTNLGALTAGRKAVYLLEKARRALVVGTPRLAGALGLSRPVDHLRKVEWTHLHAARAWVPQPYGGPLTLFVTRPRSSRPGEDPHAGWRAAALGGLTVCEIPGDDVVIVEEPRVRLLAERLGACLASA